MKKEEHAHVPARKDGEKEGHSFEKDGMRTGGEEGKASPVGRGAVFTASDERSSSPV